MATKKRNGSTEIELSELGVTSDQEFETFDVTADPAAEEAFDAYQALGELADEDTANSLAAARDEIEKQFLVEPGAYVQAVAEEGAAGLGNVVGVGLGEKYVDGLPTGVLAVKVFVREKLNPSEISAEALVPEQLGGLPTDIDATGEVSASSFAFRRRPAPGGVSIGNCTRVMAGTLGCLVRRGAQLFVLSNNHVLALSNTSPLGAGLPQPGRLDGGVCSSDVVARLTQFVPIVFGNATNTVDCAIGQTVPSLVDRRILRPGNVLQPLIAPHVPPALNTMVQKSGRTTQYRRGVVDAVNVTVNVSYAPLGGVARFTGQFRVRGLFGQPFSQPGDSGSLVTTFPANQPMGLLFAGNATANVTFCNPISAVLNALGVQIVY